MMKRTIKLNKRLCALIMASAMIVTSTAPAFAADVITDGVTNTYDEAYYATTDYYGNLLEGSVVKTYAMNGTTVIEDYGDYDAVDNLTDSTEITYSGSKVYINLGENAPKHFYFEGKTAKPFNQLPWTIQVHYLLNGVPTAANELAGKNGMVEIDIDIIPNKEASEYARNNYTLEAAMLFKQDDILSLSAPGAQVQLLGNIKTVLFVALPGEEDHFKVTVGTDEFTFGGVTFLMVPATLSSLDQISDLSGKKDDLEDNYHKLSSSLDTLLNSMNNISSLYDTASGLDQLNTVRDNIAQKGDDLYSAADSALAGLNELNQSLDKYPKHIDTAINAVDETLESLEDLNDAADNLTDDLDIMLSKLNGLKTYLNKIANSSTATAKDLEAITKLTKEIKEENISLLDDLEVLQFGVGKDATLQALSIANMTAQEANEAVKNGDKLMDIYKAIGAGSTLDYPQFAVAASTAQAGAPLSATSAAAIQKAAELTKTIETSRGVLSFDEYETALFKQMIKAGAMEQGYTEEQAAQYAEANVATYPEKVAYDASKENLQKLLALFTAKAGEDQKMNEEEFFTSIIYLNLVQTGTTETEAAKKAAALYKVYSTQNRLTTNAEKLTDLLAGEEGLSADTAALLQSTSATINAMSTMSNTLKNVNEEVDDIFDALDNLYDTLQYSTKDVKKALEETKDTVKTLQKTMTETHSFLSTFEEVLKTSRKDLNEGTKKTLEGLASALRGTAKSLEATNDIKAAKNNISNIIEDTWNDYTGDVNNLLLMDSKAQTESLTDSRNPSPESVQVVIRTQEIRVQEEKKESDKEEKETKKSNIFTKFADMFKDIWNAIIGIFKKEA